MGEEVLRRIYGPVVEEGIWRIRTNHELWELYRDAGADVKKKRLEWMGHVVRMDHGRVVKDIFESKPDRRRIMGRPRLRWLEYVEKDLQEIKVKRWR
jgi:hypothetical protein